MLKLEPRKTDKTEHIKCSHKGCQEDAVGEAWLNCIQKWLPYCERHLEEARNIGCRIRRF